MVPRLPFGELERPGTDRMTVEFGPIDIFPFEKMFGNDVHRGVNLERSERFWQDRLDGILVDHLENDRLAVDDVIASPDRIHFRVHDRIESELYVVGRERDAVVPFDVAAEVEGPHFAVLRHFPAFGQVGDHFQFFVDGQQAGKDRPLNRGRDGIGRKDGIDNGDLAAESEVKGGVGIIVFVRGEGEGGRRREEEGGEKTNN